MTNSVITHFSKICTEAKSVIEIYTEALVLSVSHKKTTGTHTTHTTTTTSMTSTSAQSHTPSQDMTMFLGTDLLWQFIYRFTYLLEILCDSNNCFNTLSSPSNTVAVPIHTFSYFDLSTYPLFSTTNSNTRRGSTTNTNYSTTANQTELPSTDFEKGK